jgi:hypothetical protein
MTWCMRGWSSPGKGENQLLRLRLRRGGDFFGEVTWTTGHRREGSLAPTQAEREVVRGGGGRKGGDGDIRALLSWRDSESSLGAVHMAAVGEGPD